MSEQAATAFPESVPEEPARDVGPEVLISNLLRSGVLVSLALVSVGMGMTFLRHTDYFS